MNRLATIRTLRSHVFILLALAVVQFWLGMTINLELVLPNPGKGGFSALAYYFANFVPILGHVVVGIAILLASLSFLVMSFRSRSRALITIGIVGFVAVVGAIYNGISFLLSGQFFGFSIGMAMSGVSAIVAYAVSLYFIGSIISENAVLRI